MSSDLAGEIADAALDAAAAAILACRVLLIDEQQECGEIPAHRYDARCQHGHDMLITACDPCMAAAVLGCATCWAKRREVVPVTFAPSPCRCKCGDESDLIGHTDRRWGRIRGRPGKYLPGHNPQSHHGKTRARAPAG